MLSPGTIDTPALSIFGDEGKKALTAAIPRGTMGRPEGIARAASFLASDDASSAHAAGTELRHQLLDFRPALAAFGIQSLRL